MSSPVIYAGKQLTATNDKLEKVSLDYIFHSLRHPKEDIDTQIRNLRIIRNIDKQRYGMLKRSLPYLVCGAFNPPYRKKENFAFTEYFFVDIDNLSQKELSPRAVKEKLVKDERVILAFLSPGEDGLKLLFGLSERCYDSGIYSLFYKIFVRKFSEQYGLDQVIDSSTSDVSRACFMSVDSDAYFNQSATPVNISDYLDLCDPSAMLDAMRAESAKDKEDSPADEQKKNEPEPDDLAIQKIKDILKLKSRPEKAKNIFIPQQLEDIMAELKGYVEKTGLTVKDIININYGKKIRMNLGMKESEINLFYGKKGFSVVISPRTGTDQKLNEVSAQMIESFLAERI
ncbi:MAG: CRISPR-associated primase-polymerase type B [Bacteroidales bacterium]|nr:CRISPR-associated primase-polymerase type B [Bacteroidales bacterium]MCI2133520.1 CRISPR-associated primase-polymerase type B [Bacteroidales bacterium]